MIIAADKVMKVTYFNIAAPTPQHNEPTLSAQHDGVGGVAGDPKSLKKYHFKFLMLPSASK